MEATTIEKVKKGDYFTLKPIEYPKENQVWVREDYDRSQKKYGASKFSDFCHDRYFKRGTIVYVDFTF